MWDKDTWSQIVVIAGTEAQVRDIHWFEHAPTQDSAEMNPLYSGGKKRRLFTTGLNGYVIEWNLLDGTVKSKFNASCAIWNSQLIGKHLFLACEDGSVKILKIKKESI